MRMFFGLLNLWMVLWGWFRTPSYENNDLVAAKFEGFTNVLNDTTRQLIVIQAVDPDFAYYKNEVDTIIAFDIRFVNSIIGKDNVVILSNDKAYWKLKGKIPEDVIIKSQFFDIWLRDYSTHVPKTCNPATEYTYDRTGSEALVQPKFDNFIKEFGLSVSKKSLKVDGGNIVDNNLDSAILTDKVYSRNSGMSQSAVVAELKSTLGVSKVAIVPKDEEVLGHADGMVSFIDDNKVMINDYNDKAFKTSVENPIKAAMPSVTFYDSKPHFDTYVHTGGFSSACGIYVNSIVTDKYIYMPTFNDQSYDDQNYNAFNTAIAGKKQVVKVDSSGVCKMGGNVRCTSWQLTGDNANKLIEAARRDYDWKAGADAVFGSLSFVFLVVIGFVMM